jgi:CHASE3 domain sensor protein
MHFIRAGSLPAEDVRYVGQIVSQRTGLTQQVAEKRVSDTYARIQAKLHDTEEAAKNAADKARKASAYAALWLFISLLIGAFVASFAATYGGRQRDA